MSRSDLPTRGRFGSHRSRLALYVVLVAMPAALSQPAARRIRGSAVTRSQLTEARLVASASLALQESPREGGDRDPFTVQEVITLLEGSLGFEAAIYLDGNRVEASDPGFGPESLVRPHLGALAPGGMVSIDLEDRPGVLARSRVATPPGDVAILVTRAALGSPRARLDDARWIPWAVLLGTAFLGWVVLPRAGPGSSGARLGQGVAALLPPLLVLAGLIVLDRQLARDSGAAAVRELTLMSVLVRETLEDGPIEEIRRVTGFPAARLSSGGAILATSRDAPGRDALDPIPHPPSSRTITGTSEASEGDYLWVARRDSGAGASSLALLRRIDPARNPPARRRLLALNGGVWAAALVFLWLARRREREAGPGSAPA